ncbi:MAG: flagellin [Jannaschia sp.]
MIRDRIDTLTEEVGSGRTSDPGRALKSDFSGLSRLTHNLQSLDAFQSSLALAETWGQAAQTSLGRIAEASARISASLPTNLASARSDGMRGAAAIARGAAEDIASALQTSVGGRAVFGNGEPGSPLSSINSLLSDIASLAAGSADFDAYVASVDAYFEPGGAYDTIQLTPVPATAVRFPVGGGETVSIDVDAGSSEIRNALKQAALIAGLENAGFDTTVASHSDVSNELQSRSSQVTSQLPVLQGVLGSAEARVALRSERNLADRQNIEMALSDMMGIDPYEAVTKLQNELSRLESLYAITARRSQLRLTDYL